MAKTYEEFEKVLCDKVKNSCSDLSAASSKNMKISALSAIQEAVSILREWYEIEEPIIGIDVSHAEDTYDNYDEPVTLKGKKEEY